MNFIELTDKATKEKKLYDFDSGCVAQAGDDSGSIVIDYYSAKEFPLEETYQELKQKLMPYIDRTQSYKNNSQETTCINDFIGRQVAVYNESELTCRLEKKKRVIKALGVVIKSNEHCLTVMYQNGDVHSVCWPYIKLLNND